LARVIQGLGGAALIVLPMAIATEFTNIQKTGRTIGFLATMSAVGTASGPSLGGFILGSYGWRAAFFFMTFLGVIGFFLLLIFVPAVQAPAAEKIETRSFITNIAAIYSDNLLKTQLAYNFFLSTIMMTTLITGPFYLAHGLNLKPSQIGLIMSAGPITSIIFGIVSGHLTDRYGSSDIMKIGLMQLFIGAFSFVFIPSIMGAYGFALCAVLLSLGYQLFLSANSSSVMKVIPADQRGTASGALSLTRNLGLMSGTFFMGGVFDFFTKISSTSGAASESFSVGLRYTFLVVASLVALLLLNHLNQQRKKYETRFIE